MTLEEQIEFEAFKEEQAAKRAKEQAKRDREAYKELVDETIEDVIPDLQATSDCIKTVKSGVLNRFRHVIDMKSDVLKLKRTASVRTPLPTRTGTNVSPLASTPPTATVTRWKTASPS